MFDMTPLPGDPGAVLAEGRKMTEAADRMRQAAEGLRKVADYAEYRSNAVDALRSNVRDLAEVMRKAEIRYRDTGNALVDYAPKLDAAQQKAAEAIAANGSTDVVGATAAAARAKAESLNPLLSPEEQARESTEWHRAKQHAAEQVRAAAHARSRYEEAKGDLNAAAAIAMARIHSANERSGLNDSWADNFRGFKDKYLVPVLDAIIQVLDVVSKITAAVAILAAFVPFLWPLSAALMAVSKVASVVTLVVAVLQVAIGERTLGALVALALTMAGGALLGKLGKGAKGAQGEKPRNWVADMNVKDGARYSWERAKHGSIDWSGGGTASGAFVEETVQDLGLGIGGDWVGDQVDSMVDPGTLWTTDDLATHDVDPVGTDFSQIDTAAILADSRGGPLGDAPVTARLGGGGGGW